MNLKYSLVFFSAGIILILFLFLMGAVQIGNIIPPASQQQEQTDGSNPETPLKEEDEDYKTQLTTVDEIIDMQTDESNPVEKMNCTEMKEFVFSFEEGWGSAVALHDERCS